MFEQQLKSVNWQSPPWSIHYPEMKNIMEDRPCVPVYNKVTNNSYCQGKFIDASDEDIKKWMLKTIKIFAKLNKVFLY